MSVAFMQAHGIIWGNITNFKYYDDIFNFGFFIILQVTQKS